MPGRRPAPYPPLPPPVAVPVGLGNDGGWTQELVHDGTASTSPKLLTLSSLLLPPPPLSSATVAPLSPILSLFVLSIARLWLMDRKRRSPLPSRLSLQRFFFGERVLLDIGYLLSINPKPWEVKTAREQRSQRRQSLSGTDCNTCKQIQTVPAPWELGASLTIPRHTWTTQTWLRDVC